MIGEWGGDELKLKYECTDEQVVIQISTNNEILIDLGLKISC